MDLSPQEFIQVFKNKDKTLEVICPMTAEFFF